MCLFYEVFYLFLSEHRDNNVACVYPHFSFGAECNLFVVKNLISAEKLLKKHIFLQVSFCLIQYQFNKADMTSKTNKKYNYIPNSRINTCRYIKNINTYG